MKTKKLNDFEYVLANPTGNITALVVSKVETEKRQFVVQQIFKNEPTCEQVGFVEPISSTEIKLEMMGNEFCGNATLCAAAYLAEQNSLISNFKNGELGGSDECLVHSSGIAAPIPVQISKNGSTYTGTLAMSIPEIEHIELNSLDLDTFEFNKKNNDLKSNFSNSNTSILNQEFPMVKLDGIYHMLIPAGQLTEIAAEQLIKKIAATFDIPAFGLILYSETKKFQFHNSSDCNTKANAVDALNVTGDFVNLSNKNECKLKDAISIKPLIYVKESDTLVWEHGCASGSIAAGYYKYTTKSLNSNHSDSGNTFETDKIDVLQPGGIITITVNDDKLLLTGTIKF